MYPDSVENYLLSEIIRFKKRNKELEERIEVLNFNLEKAQSELIRIKAMNKEQVYKEVLNNVKEQMDLSSMNLTISSVRRAIARNPVPNSFRDWLRSTKLKKDLFMKCVKELDESNELPEQTKKFIKSIK